MFFDLAFVLPTVISPPFLFSLFIFIFKRKVI